MDGIVETLAAICWCRFFRVSFICKVLVGSIKKDEDYGVASYVAYDMSSDVRRPRLKLHCPACCPMQQSAIEKAYRTR